MAIKYTTIFLVFVGTVLMLLSILQYHKLIKKCLDENYDKHKSMKKVIHISCISMMYMFLVGYILVFAVLFLTEFINFYFLVGFIFFFGAIFVATMTLTLRFMNSNLSAKNEEILEIFAKSIEMKDLYTKGHSAHVQQIVGLFYEELPSRYRNAISKRKLMDAALLHDIGKISITDSILNKITTLSTEEWLEMKKHPFNGKLILEDTAYDEIKDWVHFHHEREDGNGYYQQPADTVPVEAKLISIADAFSALFSTRPYRRKKSYAETMELLKAASGEQFNPELLGYFEKIGEAKLTEVTERVLGK